MNVFIVHGSRASKDSHWFPWLEQELQQEGIKVVRLQFPIEEDEQSIINWIHTLKPHREDLPGSILIGHSLGVPFILDILQGWKTPVKAAILVGGFQGKLDTVYDPSISNFSEREFNWKRIRHVCPTFHVINSDNDSLVPLEKGRELAELLRTELLTIEKAGHFREQDGYSDFPLVRDLVLENYEKEED